MTEPILIASALLALGRMLSKGKDGAAEAAANGPAGPPPFDLPPPAAPLVLPPSSAPAPAPTVAPAAPPRRTVPRPKASAVPRAAPRAARPAVLEQAPGSRAQGPGAPLAPAPWPGRAPGPSGTSLAEAPTARPPTAVDHGPTPRAAPPQEPTPRDQGPPLPGPAGGAPPGPVVKDTGRLDRAAELAKAFAADLKRRGRAYDRNLLAEFQKTAGLGVDGVYGPRSAGAVRWYTGESLPPISGKGFVEYAPKF